MALNGVLARRFQHTTNAARKQDVFVTGQVSNAQHLSTNPVAQNGALHLHPVVSSKRARTNNSAGTRTTAGKTPYHWSPSVLRKLSRVRHLLPFTSGQIAEDLHSSGGPTQQTTDKAIKALTGVKRPCDDLLQGPQFRAIKEQAFLPGSDIDLKLSQHESTTIAGPAKLPLVKSQSLAPPIDDGIYHVEAWQSKELLGLPYGGADTVLEEETSAPATERAARVMQSTRRMKRCRSDDGHADRVNDDREQKYNQSPRTSASQIDTKRWVELLANRGIDESQIDRIVHGLSICASSDSTRSIQEFCDQPQVSAHEPVPGLAIRNRLLSSHLPGLNHACEDHIVLLHKLDEQADNVAADVYRLLHDGYSALEATQDGESALYLAVRFGNKAVCGMLLWLGADQPFVADKLNDWLLERLLRDIDERDKDHNSSLATLQYSRRITCLEKVVCALGEGELEKRLASPTLLNICRRLDPDKRRCAERLAQHKIRKQQRAEAQKAAKKKDWHGSVFSAITPDSGYVGTPASQALYTRQPSSPSSHPQQVTQNSLNTTMAAPHSQQMLTPFDLSAAKPDGVSIQAAEVYTPAFPPHSVNLPFDYGSGMDPTANLDCSVLDMSMYVPSTAVQAPGSLFTPEYISGSYGNTVDELNIGYVPMESSTLAATNTDPMHASTATDASQSFQYDRTRRYGSPDWSPQFSMVSAGYGASQATVLDADMFQPQHNNWILPHVDQGSLATSQQRDLVATYDLMNTNHASREYSVIPNLVPQQQDVEPSYVSQQGVQPSNNVRAKVQALEARIRLAKDESTRLEKEATRHKTAAKEAEMLLSRLCGNKA